VATQLEEALRRAEEDAFFLAGAFFLEDSTLPPKGGREDRLGWSLFFIEDETNDSVLGCGGASS
jgi:hypothetical protein